MLAEAPAQSVAPAVSVKPTGIVASAIASITSHLPQRLPLSRTDDEAKVRAAEALEAKRREEFERRRREEAERKDAEVAARRKLEEVRDM